MAPGGALAEPGPVGQAHLVQDLAGLLLVARVVDAALARGQGPEGVEHEPGAEGPGLVARDEGVASEQRDEPRDAGGQQAPGGIERVRHAQPVQVGQRAAAAGGQARRDRCVTSTWARPSGRRPGHRTARGPGRRRRRVDRQRQAPGLVPAQAGGPDAATVLDRVRRRAEVHPRAAAPVLAHEADLAGGRRRSRCGSSAAAPGAREPPDLEDVGEVRGQHDDDPDLDLARRPALQHQLLVEAVRPHLPHPPRLDRRVGIGPRQQGVARGSGPSRGAARRRRGAGGARRRRAPACSERWRVSSGHQAEGPGADVAQLVRDREGQPGDQR